MSVEGGTEGSSLAKAHKIPANATNPDRPTGQPAQRGNATRLACVALVIGSVLFTLIVLEIGCRLVRDGPQALIHWPNFAAERMGIRDNADGGGACAYAYDATLGWIWPPNCRASSFSTDAQGFRRTPGGTFADQAPILAAGSSFTQGEEVGDEESWPAYLQGMIGRPTLNAGVSGYSLDQIVLNTVMIAPRVKPRLIVVAFTPDDVRRSELTVAWSRQKPYFVVTNGELDLRNVPVPQQGRASLPTLGRLFGWSALAEDITQRLGMQRGWYFDEVRGTPPGTGETVGCLLMPKLADLGVPVMMVAQYSRDHAMADAEGKARDFRTVRTVLDCATAAGLAAFDLAEPLNAAIEQRGIDSLYRTDHHSAGGNRVVADLIKRELIRRGLLPEGSGR
jgi:hypothetical protein